MTETSWGGRRPPPPAPAQPLLCTRACSCPPHLVKSARLDDSVKVIFLRVQVCKESERGNERLWVEFPCRWVAVHSRVLLLLQFNMSLTGNCWLSYDYSRTTSLPCHHTWRIKCVPIKVQCIPELLIFCCNFTKHILIKSKNYNKQNNMTVYNHKWSNKINFTV